MLDVSRFIYDVIKSLLPREKVAPRNTNPTTMKKERTIDLESELSSRF